jgi:UDP-N-acetylglucosamine--dolichyl-phosphate N-acetylglucosaminephosphotransferase
MGSFVLSERTSLPCGCFIATSKPWQGEYHNGKLYCPQQGAKGLAQLVMKITGGVSEKNLTLILIGAEVICGAGAIWLFL